MLQIGKNRKQCPKNAKHRSWLSIIDASQCLAKKEMERKYVHGVANPRIEDG